MHGQPTTNGGERVARQGKPPVAHERNGPSRKPKSGDALSRYPRGAQADSLRYGRRSGGGEAGGLAGAETGAGAAVAAWAV